MNHSVPALCNFSQQLTNVTNRFISSIVKQDLLTLRRMEKGERVRVCVCVCLCRKIKINCVYSLFGSVAPMLWMMRLPFDCGWMVRLNWMLFMDKLLIPKKNQSYGSQFKSDCKPNDKGCRYCQSLPKKKTNSQLIWILKMRVVFIVNNTQIDNY